jgi:hypothetical protein
MAGDWLNIGVIPVFFVNRCFRVPGLTLFFDPGGHRKQARPRYRWHDAVTAFWNESVNAKVGIEFWTAAAQDREHWQALEEEFLRFHSKFDAEE